jgi:hypothetical protein
MSLGDPLDYAWEKLSNALRALAGSAPLQVRLQYAYQSFHTLMAHDFEQYPELRNQLGEISARLNVVRDPEKGSVQATLDQMDDAEAEAIAEMIVDLALEIAFKRLHSAREELRLKGKH